MAAMRGVGLSLSRLCRRSRFLSRNQHLSKNASNSLLRYLSITSPVCQLSELTGSSVPDSERVMAKDLWRVVAAVCVQRMPSLGREKTALELKYQELKDQIRVEKSKLSDHELEEIEFRKAEQARVEKAQEEQITEPTGDSEEDQSNEFEDLQESREIELQEFQPAPRETEADQMGDMRSLERKLDKILYLLVKKPREEHAWQMPQGGVEGEETLIEAAQREFSEECGSDVKVKFYSSTPLAVFSYKHLPHTDAQTSHKSPPHIGSKVFFFKAFYQSGTLQLDSKELVDHVWVTREEMSDYVSEDYYKAIKPILLE